MSGRVHPIRGAAGWALDYLYAARRQVGAVLAPARDHDSSLTAARRPVLLIPGVYEPAHFLDPLARQCRELGHPVHLVDALGLNIGTFDDGVRQIGAVLDARDLREVTIVAHSKGGLLGKMVMTDAETGSRVRNMVAIATPFSGSAYARYALGRSLRAFSPRDATVVALARSLEANTRIISVYSRFDPHIPGGSRLDGAENIRVPTIGHFRVLADPQVRAAIERALR